jgi:hypothetical protein
MDRKHEKYEQLIAWCKGMTPIRPQRPISTNEELMIARHTRRIA